MKASLSGHMKSIGHQKAVKAKELQTRAHEAIDRQADAEEAAMEVVQFADLPSAVRVVAPEAIVKAPRVPTAQENELWAQAGEADFSMDFVEEGVRKQRENMKEALDMFGIWNPEGMASALGFPNGEIDAPFELDPLGVFTNPEEDEFLADLLENTG